MKKTYLFIIFIILFIASNGQQRIILFEKNDKLRHKTHTYNLPIDVTIYLKNGQVYDAVLTEVIDNKLILKDSINIQIDYKNLKYISFHSESEQRYKKAKTLTRIGGISLFLLGILPNTKDSFIPAVFVTSGITLFLHSYSFNSKISRKIKTSKWDIQTL
jgi:uncharacterized membrane protein